MPESKQRLPFLNTPSGRRHSRRGQAMVEFALVVPILALLLVMAIDFGRVFFGYVGIQNAARIGANFAASHPEAWSSPDSIIKAGLRQTYLDQIQHDAEAINCTLAAIDDPTFTDLGGTSDPTEMGDQARVRLDCQFEVLTPLAGAIVGNPVDLSGEATFTIRGGSVASIPTPIPTPAPTPAGPTPTPTPAGAPTPTPSCAKATANFTVQTSPSNGKSPQTATFANTTSAPPGCPVIGYFWNFGNGATSTAVNPPNQIYTFNGPASSKTFTITLTATNAGGTSTATKTITVKKP